MDKGGMRVNGGMYRRAWGTGEWGWEGERVGPRDPVGQEKRVELEGIVKWYKEKGMTVWGRRWGFAKMVGGMAWQKVAG